MRARTGWVAVAVLVACTGDAPVAESDEARPSRAPVAGERVEAEPLVFQIFDETVEAEPPRRVTFHLLVSRDATRDALRATLAKAMADEVADDPTIVAARAIAYYGVQTGETEADLLPFAWAEWLPVEGWYEATERSADGIHRLYFYPETPPQW